ncbi:uncharacterized protein [Palaemon carinicauda]|uniref:uncharacterized protein n=1 Tax=Palaemon carinicauda TaxID=392227 RepID=UPI0035B5ADB2
MKWIEDRANIDKREDLRVSRNLAISTNNRRKRDNVGWELREIEGNRAHGKTRKQFQGINRMGNEFQPRMNFIRNKEGNMIILKEDIQRRWIEHFRELFNLPLHHNPVDEMEIEGNIDDVESPTREEIIDAIRKLKNNKAAGIDNIGAELIKEIDKAGPNVLLEYDMQDQGPGNTRRGCTLSTLLFNSVLEWILQNTPPTTLPIPLKNTIIDRLRYDDDVDLCREYLPTIEETYVQFKNNTECTGMKLNNSKTNIMLVSKTPNLVRGVHFGGSQLEAINTFKYLGSTITSHNMIQEEVRLRIVAGTRGSWALDNTLRSRMLYRATKTQIYIVIISQLVLYGCETWAFTRTLENKLEVFQCSILRLIWGPLWDDEAGEWHNHELIALSGLPLISNVISMQRLRYAGHVVRMEERRLTRRVMLDKPKGWEHDEVAWSKHLSKQNKSAKLRNLNTIRWESTLSQGEILKHSAVSLLAWKSEEDLSLQIRKLSSMAFVPVEQVVHAFDTLNDEEFYPPDELE